MGLQFENLVLNNFRSLLAPLHMDNAMLMSAAPYSRRGGSSGGREGVQVDLLLQTRMSMCVVEIKRKASIGREIIDEVRRKCKLVPKRRGVSLHTAIVYEGEIAPSVEADGYFDAVIPFRRLLGM
jgi:hypothetical protein